MKLQRFAILFSALTLAYASVTGSTTNQLDGCLQKRVGMSLYRRGGSCSRPQDTVEESTEQSLPELPSQEAVAEHPQPPANQRLPGNLNVSNFIRVLQQEW
jgi:hypothetical protein